MQKVLTFLEKYSQWLALGVGVVVLLASAYFFILTPVAVAVGGSSALGAGEVDKYLEQNKLDKLRRVTQPQKDASYVFEGINTKNVTAPWTRQEVVISTPLTGGPAPAVARTVTPPQGTNPPPRQATVAGGPALVPLKLTDRSAGRSVVSYTDPTTPADPKNPTAAPPVTKIDRDWVSFKAPFDMAGLAAAFKAANVPETEQTQFLAVTLVRQEKNADGTWGPETVVAPLPTQEAQQLPADTAAPNDQYRYADWAKTNLEFILAPKFMDVVAGTPWYAPGTTPLADIIPAQAAGGPASPVAPSGISKPGVGLPPMKVLPPVAPRMPGFSPPGGGGTAATPASGPNTLPGAGTPDARFSPAGGQVQNFDIIAHDATVQAGKTYRYKARYTLLNPLRDRPGNKFSLTSPDGEWTDEIVVPRRVEFWLVGASRQGADFDLFSWKEGVWTKQSVKKLLPGQTIGESGWVLVDIRPERGSKAYVLVADATSRMVPRDPTADAIDSKYLELKGKTDKTGGAAAMVP